MPTNFPCPACGTEHTAGSRACRICSFDFESAARAPSPSAKCSRCGTPLANGQEYCHVCGLDMRTRLPRPITRGMSVRALAGSGPNPAGGSPPAPPAAAAAAVAPPAPLFAPAPAPPPRVALDPMLTVMPGSLSSAALHASAAAPAPAPAIARAAAAAPAIARAPAVAPAGAAHDTTRATMLRVVLVRRDGTEGESWTVGDGPIEIGRERGSMRFPDDPFISPVHARAWVVDGGLAVEDFGSRNGVYIRLVSSQPVYPGDRFLLGHHLLRLENLPVQPPETVDAWGVRGFGTPLDPAWGRLRLLGVGDQVSDIYDLRGSQVVFGREQGDVLFPRDPFLSRQHARLRMELREGAMNVLLEDLASANGTYLRARATVRLEPGEMFRIGDQLFRVRDPRA